MNAGLKDKKTLEQRARELLAKLPSLQTLDAIDNDERSGRRPCPLNSLTIAEVRDLIAALSSAAEAKYDRKMIISMISDYAMFPSYMIDYDNETITEQIFLLKEAMSRSHVST